MILWCENDYCTDGYGIEGRCIHVLSNKRNMVEAHEELLQYMKDIGLDEDAKELHHPFKNREHLDLEPTQFKALDYIRKTTKEKWRNAQSMKKPYDPTAGLPPPNFRLALPETIQEH